jgi:hypothetical protein
MTPDHCAIPAAQAMLADVRPGRIASGDIGAGRPDGARGTFGSAHRGRVH